MISKDESKSNKEQYLCVELLKKFSNREINQFTSFVESKYFNSDNLLIKLLAALQQQVLCVSSLNQALLGKVYEEVFDEKVAKSGLRTHQKKQLNYKLSALLRLAERFLVVEGLEEHVSYYSDIFYRKILEKGQFKLFNRHVKRNKKQLNAQSQKDIQHYEHQYKMERNILDFHYLNGQLATKDNLQELLYFKDVAYLIDKLSLQITLLYLENLSSKKYDTSSMSAMAALINLPQYAKHPLISIYLAAINLTKTKSDAAYKRLLSLLNTHTSSISNKDLNGFYLTAANFCAQQIRNGQFGYQNLFELYKTMDEKNLLIENNLMPLDKLRAIVAAGCRVADFDWVIQMNEKYQPFVEKRVQESVYHFNLGVVAFYQKDYEKALHHFIRVESVNFNYDINCRVIMMKAHYECDKEYDERTLQIFRSAEKYFHENKQLTPKNKKAYKNFIRILINVYRIRFGATKMKLADLKERLRKQEVNSDKAWLAEKIRELVDG